MERFDGKHAIFVSAIQYLVELTIALLVLFHHYGSRDTTVIVSLIVVAYGMIRANVSGEGAMSAMYFLELSKLMRRNVSSDEREDEGHDDLVTVLTGRDLPYTWAGAFFHMALAALAAIRLLSTLLL